MHKNLLNNQLYNGWNLSGNYVCHVWTMKQIFLVVSTTLVFSSTVTRLTTQNQASELIHSGSSGNTPITALPEVL